MAILEKEVWVGLGGSNLKHYEDKGYIIPRRIDNKGRLRIEKGTKLLVRVEDLPFGSSTRVTLECDECGKYVPNRVYNNIMKCRIIDGNDRCFECACIKGANTMKDNVKYEKSLEYYAIISEKEYLLKEFSSKNIRIPSELAKTTTTICIWECPKCGSEYDMEVGTRTNMGSNCPYCAGARVNHTNCLWATQPEIAKLLKDKQRGYEVTAGSDSKEDLICNKCNRVNNRQISVVTRYGFSCLFCSDHITFPEKVIISLLNQLGIDYETQKIFEWSKQTKHEHPKLSGTKRYDFYINEGIIIEIHGKQHYVGGFERLGGKNLELEQMNDKIKEQLAKDNGIQTYITINCSESDIDFAKNSILNSELATLFDLSNIKWDECYEFAYNTSLLKVVCDLWNKDIFTTVKIAENLKISVDSVRRYLKRGNILSMCIYDPKEEMRKRNAIHGKKGSKRVVQLTLEGEYIQTWDSATVAAEKFNISNSGITTACKGRQKSAAGYQWMLESDYEKMLNSKEVM